MHSLLQARSRRFATDLPHPPALPTPGPPSRRIGVSGRLLTRRVQDPAHRDRIPIDELQLEAVAAQWSSLSESGREPTARSIDCPSLEEAPERHVAPVQRSMTSSAAQRGRRRIPLWPLSRPQWGCCQRATDQSAAGASATGASTAAAAVAAVAAALLARAYAARSSLMRAFLPSSPRR